jgi:hypothetical protein
VSIGRGWFKEDGVGAAMPHFSMRDLSVFRLRVDLVFDAFEVFWLMLVGKRLVSISRIVCRSFGFVTPGPLLLVFVLLYGRSYPVGDYSHQFLRLTLHIIHERFRELSVLEGHRVVFCEVCAG